MRGAVLGAMGAVAFAGLFGPLACGGSSGTGGGGGSGGGGGATTTSSTTTIPTTSSTSTGDGDDTFETATTIELGTTLDSELSPAGDKDYYTFEGKAGQAIIVFIQAQQSDTTAAFDPTWIDTVVTLYDADKKQIAENTDAVPRRTGDSELFTILPADGTYYVRVEECWTWATDPAKSCAGTADKENTFYTIGVNPIDPTQKSIVLDAETGDDAAHATAATFLKSTSSSGYYLDTIYGTFKDATDVDVFSLQVPSDAVAVDSGKRGMISVYALPGGTSGDGSTSGVGKVYLTTQDDPATRIAEIDTANYGGSARIWPPADLTKPYLLFFEHPATAAGAHDFYFALQGLGQANTLEIDEAGNDAIGGAEVAKDSPDAAGAHHYYVEGDLVNGALDVDHWKFAVQALGTQVAVSCSGQRGGSGLRGLTATVLGTDGAAVPSGSATEAASTDLYTGYVAIPAGANDLVLKLSATSQDPAVSGAYYRCGIHLK